MQSAIGINATSRISLLEAATLFNSDVGVLEAATKCRTLRHVYCGSYRSLRTTPEWMGMWMKARGR